jgi:hypothetical protein
MQKEADEYKFVIPVSKVHERVASATGVQNFNKNHKKGNAKFSGWGNHLI